MYLKCEEEVNEMSLVFLYSTLSNTFPRSIQLGEDMFDFCVEMVHKR